MVRYAVAVDELGEEMPVYGGPAKAVRGYGAGEKALHLAPLARVSLPQLFL